MSGPTLPPAAARQTGAAGGSVLHSASRRPLLRTVRHRLLVIVGCMALSVMAGLSYVLKTTPVYRATAILATGYGATTTGTLPPDEFLTGQRSIIESSDVMAAGASAAPSIANLRASGRENGHVRVRTSSSDGTIAISVEAANPNDAAAAANAIAAAYLQARGG